MVEYGIAAGSKGGGGVSIADWAGSLTDDPTTFLVAGAVAVVLIVLFVR